MGFDVGKFEGLEVGFREGTDVGRAVVGGRVPGHIGINPSSTGHAFSEYTQNVP